jgi:TIR domain
MMGFLQPAKPDIFVSYAHVNDVALTCARPGWVSAFVSGVKNLLAMKLGRDDVFDLWMDDRLAGNHSVTPEIIQELGGTSLLLIVLSHGYLASTWCRSEMNNFRREVERRKLGGQRIFLVEFEPVERPRELADLLGYRFWVNDRSGKPPRTLGFPQLRDGDDRYYDLLNDLSHDLAGELRRLKDAQTAHVTVDVPPTSTVEPSQGRRVVFLAEATDDLDDLRDEVRRHLTQADIRVLPETDYPRDEASFRRAVASDLARSTLFVQLLSRVAGKKPAGSEIGYVALQHACAAAAKVPILQWRSRDVDLMSSSSSSWSLSHLQLLTGESVVASDLGEFIRLAVRRVDQLTAPPPPSLRAEVDSDKLVFVNAEENDHALAVQIAKVLCKKGVATILPARCCSPEKVREVLVESLIDCDALVMVHGDNPDWLVRQWDQFRKVKPKRSTSLKAVGLCASPPPGREACNLMVPGAHLIDCRLGVQEELFEGFLSSF